MEPDLFNKIKRPNKKNMLMNWMRNKHVFATHEVISWGSENFYNRAAQTKSDLLKEGFIEKLDGTEKAARGYRCKDEVYVCKEY